ncbi:MAG TPA: nucleoside triphosphate pyrophosphatase [Steroidobacteraceae bacterium]|nr:nucleoside triphosphate pyrophosphatase [Steroidobacteraceae bacterium]
MPPLILASTSPWRRELLARLAVDFEVVAPEIPEEHLPGESPTDRALRLATAKAQAVSTRHPHALVLGSDQVATSGGEVLDKPGDARRCREQLRRLSGHTAHFYTACVLLGAREGPHLAHVDTTTVVFRELSAGEIDRYVEREQPFDCAGGFRAEALGIALFDCIESQDPTALIGLPLIWLAGALRAAGFQLP